MKIEICIECKKEKKIHAKGMCIACYSRWAYKEGGYIERIRKYRRESKEYGEKINKYRKEYYSKNKEKLKNKARNWQKNNYEKCSLRARESLLKKHYGIDLSEYNEIYNKQNGKCKICGKWCSKLYIDHDHIYGNIRDLLCRRCNLVIGQVHEDVNIIFSMKLYLERWRK